MGSVGGAYDKARSESFRATLETELLDRRRVPPHAEARLVVFAFLEGGDNPHRHHSSVDDLSRSASSGGIRWPDDVRPEMSTRAGKLQAA